MDRQALSRPRETSVYTYRGGEEKAAWGLSEPTDSTGLCAAKRMGWPLTRPSGRREDSHSARQTQLSPVNVTLAASSAHHTPEAGAQIP